MPSTMPPDRSFVASNPGEGAPRNRAASRLSPSRPQAARRLSKFFPILRRCLRSWVASFGQAPGLSRDVGLPLTGAAVSTLPDACEDVARSAAQRALASELLWGAQLKLEAPPSLLRACM